jgi:hypothetical protein
MQRLTSKLQKIQIRFNNISPLQGSDFCYGPVPPVAPGVIHITPLRGIKISKFVKPYDRLKNCGSLIESGLIIVKFFNLWHNFFEDVYKE